MDPYPLMEFPSFGISQEEFVCAPTPAPCRTGPGAGAWPAWPSTGQYTLDLRTLSLILN